MKNRLIDLTHTFDNNTPVYPGDPKSEFKKIASVEKNGFTDHFLSSGMHVGTHMDAPMHMISGGHSIAEYDVSKFFGTGKLIDVTNKKEIGLSAIENKKINEGDIVLFMTGFSEKYFEKTYFENYPTITKELAQKLIDLKVKMVCLDTTSPDYAPFDIHKILLGAGIIIVENCTNFKELKAALDKGAGDKNDGYFEIISLPAKYGLEAAPTRIIAKV